MANKCSGQRQNISKQYLKLSKLGREGQEGQLTVWSGWRLTTGIFHLKQNKTLNSRFDFYPAEHSSQFNPQPDLGRRHKHSVFNVLFALSPSDRYIGHTLFGIRNDNKHCLPNAVEVFVVWSRRNR